MKLFKPSHSYGASQRNFSEYEYQDHRSQSNNTKYECDNKPNTSNYNIQAPEYLLGQSFGECEANEFSQARTNTNFYASPQCAYPSPSIHVQQGHHDHVMEKMTRKESQVGQEWAGNSPKFSNTAQLNHYNQTMQNEKHMMGEMGNSWAKKPNQYSSQDQKHNFAQSMYNGRDEEAYTYSEDETQGGYANTATMHATPNYLSPIKTSQSSLLSHNSEHKLDTMDDNWANSTSNFSSPTQAQYSGTKMHNREHMSGNTNVGWSNSPTKLSGSAQAYGQQSHLSMQRKEHMMENKDHDLGYLPNKFTNPTQAHSANMSHMAMHKEGHTMGKMDHGWSNSTPKLSSSTPIHHSSQAHHTNMSMHKGGHMMGAMDNSWDSSPTKFSSGLATGKEKHMMGNSNHGWANSPTHYSGPNHFSGSNTAMHREHKQHEWGGNSSNQYGANHVNSHLGHSSYDNCDQYADEDVNDIMDEILTKYPAHNISGGHNGSSWGTNLSSCASQNLATGHAKQQAFGNSSHYRNDAQAFASASSNSEANKHMNTGYSSSFKKEEFSTSSSEKKFETKGLINKGGYYDDII